MDILLNELSLHSQFENIDDFLDNSFSRFVRIFHFLNKIENPLLKNYNFYNCQITDNESFYSLVTNRKLNRISDSVRKYKTLLDKIPNEPYWEANQQQDINSKYFWNNEDVSGSSIAESYAREAILISFCPSRIITNPLVVTQADNKKEISNYTDNSKLVEFLYANKHISFSQYCNEHFKDTKLNFEYINTEKSFNSIQTVDDESEFLNSFNLFCNMTWQSIIEQGGKGKNKVGLAYQQHHNQDDFASYNISYSIDKFRCSKRYRAFGYRKGNVFYLLEFDLTHKLSD